MFDPWTATENEAKKEDAKRKKIRSFFDKCIEKNKDLESTSDGENQFAELKLDSIRVSAQTQRRIAQEMLEEQSVIKECICTDQSGNIRGLGSIGFMEKINQILEFALPAPEWLATMFKNKFLIVYDRLTDSWDDYRAFGLPKNKNAHYAKYAKEMELGLSIFLGVFKERMLWNTSSKNKNVYCDKYDQIDSTRKKNRENEALQLKTKGEKLIFKGLDRKAEGSERLKKAIEEQKKANELIIEGEVIEKCGKAFIDQSNQHIYEQANIPPLDTALFEKIGEDHGVSKTVAKDSYYEWLKRTGITLPKKKTRTRSRR